MWLTAVLYFFSRSPAYPPDYGRDRIPRLIAGKKASSSPGRPFRSVMAVSGHKYVYRLRGNDARYLVAANQPLKLDLMVPVKFAPLRRHLLIQDSDGKECKVSMVERDKTALGRWK